MGLFLGLLFYSVSLRVCLCQYRVIFVGLALEDILKCGASSIADFVQDHFGFSETLGLPYEF